MKTKRCGCKINRLAAEHVSFYSIIKRSDWNVL